MSTPTGSRKGVPLSLRVTTSLKARLDLAARENGCSQSEEVERRLMQAFEMEDAIAAQKRWTAWAAGEGYKPPKHALKAATPEIKALIRLAMTPGPDQEAAALLMVNLAGGPDYPLAS